MAKIKKITPKVKGLVVTPKNVKKVVKAVKKTVKDVIAPLDIAVPKETGQIKLTVIMNGETFVTETNDIAGALVKLNPNMFKTKVIIKAEYNGRVAERMLFILQAKQIFRNSVLAVAFSKNLKTILNA